MSWMQSASSRWLGGIALFAAVLIVVSVLISVFASDDELLPADTPEGAIQRYLQALADNEFTVAYEFVGADLREDCTLEHFIRTTSYLRDRKFSASLSHTTDVGGKTVVSVEITEQSNSGPFGSGQYSSDSSFTVGLEDGEWRITETPWPIFFCPPNEDLPTRPAIPPAKSNFGALAPSLSAETPEHRLQVEEWRPLWTS